MDKIKNILFEYSTLFLGLVIMVLSKEFLFPDASPRSFAFITFIIYLRHYHIGETVSIEVINNRTVVVSPLKKRKLLYPLDIFAYPVAAIFLFEITNFYQTLILFIFWFIITDIFRVRYSIYGQYISRWFYTSKININSSKWKVHLADKDPFPSVPHMHAISSPLKLNIYTGEIYDSKTNKLVEIASKKDLKKLWADPKFMQIVSESRKIYVKENPKYKLADLPKFK